MARLVVVKFDDNDDADDFISHSDGQSSIIHRGEVVGLFAFPTVFCEGFGGCGTGRIKSFFRGPKYGWWVCARCGKPSKQTTGEKLIRQVCSQARNLIGNRPCEVASTFDEGWGAYGRK